MDMYPFDEGIIEVWFNAKPGADAPVKVGHRLHKPTLQELLDREKAVNLEIIETGNREEQIVTDDEAATCRMWDKLIDQIKGYKGAADWRPLADEEKAQMRASHKVMAIRTMYAGGCSVVGDEDEVSLGADTWTIRQAVGLDEEAPLFEVLHILREPTESERAKFRKSSSKVSFIRGSKRPRTKIAQDLRAFVEMYDALIQDVTGGTVGGQSFQNCERPQFLAAIDPTWKRLVVQTLMNGLEAALLD